MINIDLLTIELNLKKRLKYQYKWFMKQNNSYDHITNFIYSIYDFDQLLKYLESNFSKSSEYKKIFNYSLNRWYNFWSAYAIEKIFCSLPGVEPFTEKNKYSDFVIQGINFDHKTTVYPKNYPLKINDAINKKEDLILWLYQNQSSGQRFHLKNRLFVVLYNNIDEHWKLKAEISYIKPIIENYILNFSIQNLSKIHFLNENDYTILSDIIWVIK